MKYLRHLFLKKCSQAELFCSTVDETLTYETITSWKLILWEHVCITAKSARWFNHSLPKVDVKWFLINNNLLNHISPEIAVTDREMEGQIVFNLKTSLIRKIFYKSFTNISHLLHQKSISDQSLFSCPIFKVMFLL